MLLKKLVTITLLASAAPAFAALAGTVQWDVRTTGSNSNAGCFDPGVASPGTDYSQQDSPQVAFTDLVIGGTNTQLTSMLNPFSAASVGNCIHITGGTGFTTGWYEVTSVSVTTATMDRAVGTAASTNGTGNLGGSFLTIAATLSSAVDGNTLNIKSGTYTLTSTLTVGVSLYFVGYGTAHADGGTKPLITTSTNSTPLFATAANIGTVLDNLAMTNTASTRALGIYATSYGGSITVLNCYASGFGGGTDNGAFIDGTDNTHWDYNAIIVMNSEIANSVSGIYASTTHILAAQFVGNYFHDNGIDVYGYSQGSTQVIGNIFSSSTGSFSVGLQGNFMQVRGNTFYNAAGSALLFSIQSNASCVQNNIFYGNLWAINQTTSASGAAALCATRNAYGSNKNANINFPVSATSITLSANPFVNAAAANFALNNTAGGGAALRAVASPQGFGSNGTTYTSNYLDVGTAQHQDTGGGGATNSAYAN
jgi:hypothetical protein